MIQIWLINLSKGKNLVGSIYHPSKIIIDPSFLKTLSHREYYSGMVAIIKYGLILDKDLYNIIKLNFENINPDNSDSGYYSLGRFLKKWP